MAVNVAARTGEHVVGDQLNVDSIASSLLTFTWRQGTRIEAVIMSPLLEEMIIDSRSCEKDGRNLSTFLGLFPPRLLMQSSYNECAADFVEVAELGGHIYSKLKDRKFPSPEKWLGLKSITNKLRHLADYESTRALSLLRRNDLRPIEQGLRAKEYSGMQELLCDSNSGLLETMKDGEFFLVVQVADRAISDQLVGDWKEMVQYLLEKRYGAHTAAYKEHIAKVAELSPGALYAYATILARINGYPKATNFMRVMAEELDRLRPRPDGTKRLAVAGGLAVFA